MTTSPCNIDHYDINYTLMGDEIWINTHISETIPDVFSPLTWSISNMLDESLSSIPEYYSFSGNIYGKPYSNISRRVSMIQSILGPFSKNALKMIFDIYGELPKGITIPNPPMSRKDALKLIVPKAMSIRRESRNASKTLKLFIKTNPEWQRQMKLKIENADTPDALLQIWLGELKPYIFKAWLSAGAAATGVPKIMALNKKLTRMVGPENSCMLMSNLRGEQELESLGPTRGISKVLSGEISHEHYTQRYGHRGAHEYELSLSIEAEDPKWIQDQVKEYESLDMDVERLLRSQQKKFDETFIRFIERYPNKIMWLKKQLKDASEAINVRERVYSEFMSVYRLIRLFANKAGTFYNLEEDVYFLYIEEIENLLSSSEFKQDLISIRRMNYEKYRSMPSFPSIIKGRFDPEAWAKDSDRRMDFYDVSIPNVVTDSTDMLKGKPISAGSVKGLVRVIHRFEDADQILPGEILVASTTNIGWTTFFPKVSAIITDIGTPLSCAAIVAREMGIPSVFGCGNATIKLKTGDKVRVDGGQGTVEIL